MTTEQIDQILKLLSNPKVGRTEIIDVLLDLRKESTQTK